MKRVPELSALHPISLRQRYCLKSLLDLPSQTSCNPDSPGWRKASWERPLIPIWFCLTNEFLLQQHFWTVLPDKAAMFLRFFLSWHIFTKLESDSIIVNLYHRGTPSLSISRALLLSCSFSSRKSFIDKTKEDITTVYLVSASTTISITLFFVSLVNPSIIIARSTSDSRSKSPRAFEPKR